MKKIVSLLLTVLFVLSFAACGQTAVKEPEPTPTPEPAFSAEDFAGVYLGVNGSCVCLKADGTAVYYQVCEEFNDVTWELNIEESILTVKIPEFGYDIYAYVDDGPMSLSFLSKDRSWVNETFLRQNTASTNLSYKDFVRLINALLSVDNSECHELAFEGLVFQIPDYYGAASIANDGASVIYAEPTRGCVSYAKLYFYPTVLEDEQIELSAWNEWASSLLEEAVITEDNKEYLVESAVIDKAETASYVYAVFSVPYHYGNVINAVAYVYSPNSKNINMLGLECYEDFSEDYIAHFKTILDTYTLADKT